MTWFTFGRDRRPGARPRRLAIDAAASGVDAGVDRGAGGAKAMLHGFFAMSRRVKATDHGFLATLRRVEATPDPANVILPRVDASGGRMIGRGGTKDGFLGRFFGV